MHVYTLNPADFTPVMQQYLKARQKLTGKSVLFFRMGDFYEAFFDDAEIIAQELEITLTGRPEQKYPGGRLPMAGVPAKAIKPYVARLLDAGFRVYIAEQMADPKTCKGLVPREITKVFTPGTINDLDLLDSFQNNFILSLLPNHFKTNPEVFGLAYADISTGEFYLTEIKACYLEQELLRINPAEILSPCSKAKKQQGQIVAEDEIVIDTSLITAKHLLTPFDKTNFSETCAKQNLAAAFAVLDYQSYLEQNFSVGSQGLALKAAGALIEYLKETLGAEFKEKIEHNFDVLKTYQVDHYMMLDASTRRNLEITQSLNGAASSLFKVIDQTSTKLGKRTLKSWLEQPLYDLEQINLRSDTVSELIAHKTTCYQIKEALKGTYDIERLANRLASGLVSPRELLQLKDSLTKVMQVSTMMTDLASPLIASLKNLPADLFDFVQKVDSAINEDPGLTITDGKIIKFGFNPELDEFITLIEDSETWLAGFVEAERDKLGIKNLKVNFNKVHGYFLETSRVNQSKLGEGYTIKQTMVNNVRATTQELAEFEEKITNAQSKRNGLEYQIYSRLRKDLAQYAGLIKTIARNVARLDALQSLATLAVEQAYVKPILDESNAIEIIEGRHPVVERSVVQGSFVPNDLQFAVVDEASIMILTGPNMAGKSTFMRQNALIILLAQIGSYVPANSAKIGLVDRIFTRIGASDDLASGRSTFMVEMTETAAILNGMSERSFIVLDEIGRGTSTYDGVAIAWSIVEHIAKTTRARTIFATHYHELANLDKLFTCIKNFQVLVAENKASNAKSRIEFLHKVVPGSADKSYGIEVARLAGLPVSVLQRAQAINNQLQTTRNQKLGLRRKDVDVNMKQALGDDGNLNIEKLPLFEQKL